MDNNWSKDALVQVLTENLKEQKKERRWKTFGRVISLGLLAIIVLMVLFSGPSNKVSLKSDPSRPHAAVIEISGMIDDAAFYGNADNVINSLREAYSKSNMVGVILDLNSPGGSPVQSDLIYKEIVKLQAEDPQNRKVYGVISDICASGCYYVAAAAHEIYANELSTVGSIGVLSGGFGFVDIMKKVGVERRVQTSGKFKAFMDPFTKQSAENKQFLQKHLDEIHKIFIDRVMAGRGNRLKPDEDTFTGLFWTGQQSVNLGLIDGIQTKTSIANGILKVDNLVNYTVRPSIGDLFAGNIPRVSSQLNINNLLSMAGTNTTHSTMSTMSTMSAVSGGGVGIEMK